MVAATTEKRKMVLWTLPPPDHTIEINTEVSIMSTQRGPTLATLNTTEASQAGLPQQESVLLAKALLIIARKLDRDAGVTDTTYEALVLAATTISVPATVVP